MSEALQEAQPIAVDPRITYFMNLGFYLTVVARDSYGEANTGSVQAHERLRCFNEMHHTIYNHLLALACQQAEAYSDDEVIATLKNQAKNGGCKEEFEYAYHKAQ